MRVLVVDDHAISRLGLATFLGTNVSEVIVEAASNLDAATLTTVQRDIALVLVDCSVWHGRRESEPHFSFGALFPGVPVVVTRGVPDPAEAERALAAGATGYLLRTAEPADLRAMLVRLLSPVQARSPGLGGGPAAASERGAGNPLPPDDAVYAGESGVENGFTLRLTPREREVIRLLLNGRTNKEIGRALSVSDGTIKAHVHNIMRKIGTRNRIELVHKMHGRTL